jgi:hypothetical protein
VRALSDIQAGVRRALVTGDASGLDSVLRGGGDARRRLAVHQRHYAATVVKAVVERFPATEWLTGTTFLTGVARAFVSDHPPSRPCLAEYGETFPEFLASQPGAERLPYLRDFAALEWHLGRLALAADAPPMTVPELAGIDVSALTGARLTLQGGVHYLHLTWGVDALIRLYLTDEATEQFSLEQGDILLEVRGDRGELRMNRLSPAAFAFRETLAGGRSIGEAAAAALEVDEGFEAGEALVTMVGDGLVSRIADSPAAGGDT